MASKSNRSTPATIKPSPPRSRTPAQAADSVALNQTKTPRRPAPSEDQIRARAFFLWEQAGRPESDGVQFWLEAEKELNNPR